MNAPSRTYPSRGLASLSWWLIVAFCLGAPASVWATPHQAHQRKGKSPKTKRSKKHRKKGLRRLDLRPRRLPRVAQAAVPASPTTSGNEPAPKTASLAQVLGMAQKSNVDLQLLRKRLKLAEIARARAWVALRPTFGATASYTRNQVPVEFNGATITPQNQLDFNLQMNWTFLNLQIIPGINAANMQAKQTKEQARQTKRELYFSVVRGYYNILLTQGSVDIAKRSLGLAQQTLETAKTRVKAGVATPINEAQARLDVARARQQWQGSQNSLRNARLAMALLLGRPTFDYRAARPAAPILPNGQSNDWLLEARRRRSELKSSKLAVSVARQNTQKAWMQYLPTGGLTGGARVTNATGFAGQNVQWNLGVSLNWQIYGGGARALAVKEAHTRYQQSMLELKKMQQKIDNEVRTAAVNLQNARQAATLAQRNASLAKQTYDLQKQRYKSGLATPLDVSNAMNGLFSAEVTYLRERLNQELAVLGVRRVVGVFAPQMKKGN